MTERKAIEKFMKQLSFKRVDLGQTVEDKREAIKQNMEHLALVNYMHAGQHYYCGRLRTNDKDTFILQRSAEEEILYNDLTDLLVSIH